MRFVLIMLFAAICSSASAQWYRFGITKKVVRPEAVDLMVHFIAVVPAVKVDRPKLYPVSFALTNYSLEAQEAVIMKTAQHNMRFRVYHDASYNFTELAHLFVQQKRYSEAIWYLLQSNSISRDENDDKHTIANLVDIATIKACMGEIPLAQLDLNEAHDLAYAKGLKDELETVDLAMQYITQNKLPKQKPVLIYADGAQNNGKAE
jgi:hypothetical protein